jgi:hypothetical protein
MWRVSSLPEGEIRMRKFGRDPNSGSGHEEMSEEEREKLLRQVSDSRAREPFTADQTYLR